MGRIRMKNDQAVEQDSTQLIDLSMANVTVDNTHKGVIVVDDVPMTRKDLNTLLELMK